jgi:hypothetical protein
MKAQIPAQGILKHSDYGTSMSYHVACNCGSPDCSHNVWIEAETEPDMITITTYTMQKTDYWTESAKLRYDKEGIAQWFDWFWKGLWNGLMIRLRLTKNIWFDGYAKYEAGILMNEQEALNYAETLKRSINDVREFKKEKNVRNK